MAKDDALKEEQAQAKADAKLREQQAKQGWFLSEWGEWCPPVNEIDNSKNPAKGKTKVTQNKVVIPAVAKPAEEE